MKYFDSHCHLDFEPLSTEVESIIERAAKAGVSEMINVGSSMRGSRRSVEIANSYPNIWATVGLHPHDAEEVRSTEDAIDELEELAGNDQVVAIGEIGLDYFHPEKKISREQKEKQGELFEAQLELAKRLDLPVVLHSRDADADMISSLKKVGVKNGVVHCFTGDKGYAKKLLDLGFYIGFTGFVTFDQKKFDDIREACKVVPMSKLLIETDAPFLAPEPHRGKANEPAYVVEVAKKVAEIKKLTEKEVAEKTLKNTHKLFGLT